jgi:hypothetical protein
MLRHVGFPTVIKVYAHMLMYHRKSIAKDDADRYTNEIKNLLEHLESIHGDIYAQAKEQAEKESQAA